MRWLIIAVTLLLSACSLADWNTAVTRTFSGHLLPVKQRAMDVKEQVDAVQSDVGQRIDDINEGTQKLREGTGLIKDGLRLPGSTGSGS
jgi:hypothetical protein